MRSIFKQIIRLFYYNSFIFNTYLYPPAAAIRQFTPRTAQWINTYVLLCLFCVFVPDARIKHRRVRVERKNWPLHVVDRVGTDNRLL